MATDCGRHFYIVAVSLCQRSVDSRELSLLQTAFLLIRRIALVGTASVAVVSDVFTGLCSKPTERLAGGFKVAFFAQRFSASLIIFSLTDYRPATCIWRHLRSNFSLTGLATFAPSRLAGTGKLKKPMVVGGYSYLLISRLLAWGEHCIETGENT